MPQIAVVDMKDTGKRRIFFQSNDGILEQVYRGEKAGATLFEQEGIFHVPDVFRLWLHLWLSQLQHISDIPPGRRVAQVSLL